MNEHLQLLQTLQQHEEELQFWEFTNETAVVLGLRLLEAAKRERKTLTIDICRNGQQLFHAALPGTSADNDLWIKRKNNVVNHYGHSSFYVGTDFRARGKSFEQDSRLPIEHYAAHGGAFPVIVRNVGVVGTVTVSGLPQAEDHEFVVRELRAFLSDAKTNIR
jgi:uncharacterized protein (UPF0303 family)